MKTNIFKILGVLIVVGGIIAALIFTGTASTKKSLVIGVISPLTGQYAAFGENFVKGAELARQELNASSTLLIELVVEDDSFEAKKGMSAYKKLIDINRAQALIVGTSATINAIYPEVSGKNMPVVTYGSQAIDEKDDNIFHVYPSSIPVVKGLAQYVASTTNAAVSALVTNDIVTQKFLGAFKSEFLNDELRIHLVQPDTQDVRTDVLKMLSEKPDYIFLSNLAGIGTKAVKEILTLRGKQPRPVLIFDLTFNEAFSEYQKILRDTKILDGSIVATTNTTSSSEFAERYKKAYGADPGPLADFGYDSVMLLVDSYNKNSEIWILNLSRTNRDGATNSIVFDEVGRRIPEFKVTRIVNVEIPAYK